MGNEQLRAAITASGLTQEEFADIVEVDVKTIQRWLAGRTPYRRHRARIAAALDTTEHALWPEDAPPDPTSGPPTGTADDPTTGPADRVPGDVITGYARADDPDAPRPADLLRAAKQQIEIIAERVAALVSDPGLIDQLAACAKENGCEIRVIIGDPDLEVAELCRPGEIDTALSGDGEEYNLYRADDHMLLLLTRLGAPHSTPPMLHIHRRVDGGLFDRMLDEYERSWADATHIPTPKDLHRHRYAIGWSDEDIDTPFIAPETPPPARPSEPPRPDQPHTTGITSDRPRRWPGRDT